MDPGKQPAAPDHDPAPGPGAPPAADGPQIAGASPDPSSRTATGGAAGAASQAPPPAATTAPAPPVLAEQTTSPQPALTTGTPAPGANPPAAIATGAGHSVGATAAEAAAADRAQPPAVPAPDAPPPQTAPTDTGARAAALIREQMEPLVLRISYDAQELVRVGAEGPDPVTIRTILETFAAALEHGDEQTFAYTYSRAARPGIPQINDQVLPFRLGMQIGGMFEGVLRDTFDESFRGDPALRAASVQLLEQWAGQAKRALLGEPRELVQWQAPRI